MLQKEETNVTHKNSLLNKLNLTPGTKTILIKMLKFCIKLKFIALSAKYYVFESTRCHKLIKFNVVIILYQVNVTTILYIYINEE